jgi:DNA-directed RNA polymerase specialized sigma24 family protein
MKRDLTESTRGGGENRSEAETIRLAQQGSATAFERLYELHSRRAYAVCLRLVGNAAEAEDLTREIFSHSFRGIQSFSCESNFSAYLYCLTVDLAFLRLREKIQAGISPNDPAKSSDQGSGPLIAMHLF